MKKRPDWLVPGAEVAVLRVGGGLQRSSVTFATIDRVLKRDVVLDNGERFNGDRLRRHGGGAWGWFEDLLPRDDKRVLRAVAETRERKAWSVVARFVDDLSKATRVHDRDAAAAALADARDALAALPEATP